MTLLEQVRAENQASQEKQAKANRLNFAFVVISALAAVVSAIAAVMANYKQP